MAAMGLMGQPATEFIMLMMTSVSTTLIYSDDFNFSDHAGGFNKINSKRFSKQRFKA